MTATAMRVGQPLFVLCRQHGERVPCAACAREGRIAETLLLALAISLVASVVGLGVGVLVVEVLR